MERRVWMGLTYVGQASVCDSAGRLHSRNRIETKTQSRGLLRSIVLVVEVGSSRFGPARWRIWYQTPRPRALMIMSLKKRRPSRSAIDRLDPPFGLASDGLMSLPKSAGVASGLFLTSAVHQVRLRIQRRLPRSRIVQRMSKTDKGSASYP